MAVGGATGAIIDLTPGAGSWGTINGANFHYAADGGGTGVIRPFVRLQGNEVVQGYNTSVAKQRDLPFDEMWGHTHDMRLNQIPLVKYDEQLYMELLLDINEASGGGNQYISLDRLQIYTSPVGGQNTKDVDSLGMLRYSMGQESSIWLDYSLNSGSGVIDMTARIPLRLFDGASPTDFVYVYSLFGQQGRIDDKDFSASAGFEEWAVRSDSGSWYIPEPAALLLLAGGMLMVLPKRRGRGRSSPGQ